MPNLGHMDRFFFKHPAINCVKTSVQGADSWNMRDTGANQWTAFVIFIIILHL